MKREGRKTNRIRLSVHRSNRHIIAQLIDDSKGITLASSSTLLRKNKDSSDRLTAEEVGIDIARKAKKLNITKIYFDRGRSAYHGQLVKLADAARKEGLEF